MTVAKIRSCVTQGLCTWEQVRQTLSNAGVSDREIDDFLAGRSPIGRAQREMLYRLLETGEVPTPPAVSYTPDPTTRPSTHHASEELHLPELLFCLGVLRNLPASAPSPMNDAMFGPYRRIRYDEPWVRQQFGKCDSDQGPHRFFAYSAFNDDHPVATVWTREDEGDHEVLEQKIREMFHMEGSLALRREIHVHG